MSIRIATMLAFFTAFIFVAIKSFSDPDSAMMGMAILVCGWVSIQIIKEGLIAIFWLLIGRLAEKEDVKRSQENDDDE